jgi:hypothetical protein
MGEKQPGALAIVEDQGFDLPRTLMVAGHFGLDRPFDAASA